MTASRLFTSALIAGLLSTLSTAAIAACSGTYCTQSHNSGYALLNSVAPASTYSSYSTYSAPVPVSDHPAALYAYEGANTSSYGSTSSYSDMSQFTLADTGYSAGYASDVPAGMCPTACDVSVDAPAGSRVLACYAACPTVELAPAPVYTPAPVTQSYQIVRPIVVVPYPVPVMAPSQCGPIYDAPSRYGSSYGQGGCSR